MRPWPPAEPDYAHQQGDNILLAPPEPLLHRCPDCTAEEEDWVKRTKALVRKVYRLQYLRSLSEQWGSCITRHDVYRCRNCRAKYVSTNGGEPQVAADGL